MKLQRLQILSACCALAACGLPVRKCSGVQGNRSLKPSGQLTNHVRLTPGFTRRRVLFATYRNCRLHSGGFVVFPFAVRLQKVRGLWSLASPTIKLRRHLKPACVQVNQNYLNAAVLSSCPLSSCLAVMAQ